MLFKTKYESEELKEISLSKSIKTYHKVILFIILFIILLLFIGFLVKYPEKVKGKVSIVSDLQINKVYSQGDGEIQLLINNHSFVKKGKILAFLKTPTNYKNLIELKKELKKFNIEEIDNSIKKTKFNYALKLGEIGKKYNEFLLALIEYKNIIEIDIKSQKINNLKLKIERNQEKFLDEKALEKLISKKSNIIINTYNSDSLLFTENAITKNEINKSEIDVINIKEKLFNIKERKKEILHFNKEFIGEIEELKKEKKEKRLTLIFNIKKSYFELLTAIEFWEYNFLVVSPIDGKVEFNAPFLSSDQYIKKNMPLFIILPKVENFYARGVMPANGYGKIKNKDTIYIKLNDYPYKEYGQLKGVIENKSKVYHDSIYYIDIELPYSLKTNRSELIKFTYNMSGEAEYFTNKRSVIQRIFSDIQNSISE